MATKQKTYEFKIKPCYTTGDLSKLFGIGQHTVDKLLDKGDLRFWRVPNSKHRRIDHSALVSFLKSHPEFELLLPKVEGHNNGPA
jgi:excisionase family DNA binding protein